MIDSVNLLGKQLGQDGVRMARASQFMNSDRGIHVTIKAALILNSIFCHLVVPVTTTRSVAPSRHAWVDHRLTGKRAVKTMLALHVTQRYAAITRAV